MDFIEQLPPLEGYTNILVVVDQLTKQAIFISIVRSIDTVILVGLFVKHVVTLQANFPQKITFNMLYNNKFLIGICSRTLSIILRT